MILRDPYALNRKWWDRDWRPDETSRDWTTWDFVLADVYQVIQDYTDPNSGQIMWFDQSGDVWWDAKKIQSGSLTEIAEKEEKNPLKPGERYYATPVFKDPDNKPTMESWLKDMENDSIGVPTQHRGARKPTKAELDAMS